MSTIFGILGREDRAVEVDDLNRMQRAMAGFEADGSGLWTDKAIGLGQSIRYNTPESVYETLPLKNRSSQVVLTASARLDNRADLFRRLDIPPSERANMPDGCLILKAYEKWDTQCPNYLLGDWAFALWDARRPWLFIARDRFGSASLYYYQDKHYFIFASSLKGILALPRVCRRLNEVAIAQLSEGGKRDASTFYKDIFQLTPAQSMTVTAEKTVRQHYWDPQHIPDVRFSSDRDYLDAFLEIYSEAVSCRLRSYPATAVTLSGGLDSGSVATLAARELARKGQRLKAISWRPSYDVSQTVSQSRTGDETPFIQDICHRAGNIDVTFAQAKGLGPIASIRQAIDILEQPSYIIAGFYWFMALLRTAQQQNIGTLLTGTWGNMTVSWTGNREQYVLALLNSGQWGEVAREVNGWRQEHRSSLWRAIISQVVKPLSEPVWLWQRQRSRPQRSMIKPDVARPILKTNPMTDPNLEARRRQATQPLRSIYNMFQSGNLAVSPELGAAFGVDVRTPTIDKRIVEFCLGIPQEQYTRAGREKLLIRQAMSDFMPERVLWNQRRGMLGGDLGQWLCANLTELERILQQLQKSSLAQYWLDLAKMNRTFNALQQAINPATQKDMQIFLRGITVGLFLLRFE